MNLDNLNTNQKEAVLHTQGPLLILAGAGSGKTRVITQRIARLIQDEGVAPYRIFAVTFTNKAAAEMKKRVIDLVGPSGNSVFIKTFHAAGVYILRRYGEAIGIPRSFSIYDDSDQQSLVKKILERLRLDPKKVSPSMIVSKISEIKDKAELMEGTDPSLLVPGYLSFNFAEIYAEYHRQLRENNALDFNDLLIKTVELLRSGTGILETLQRTWSHFMIDEYQDTNYAQYLIAKLLASGTRNICVVGDDDQSIYSWRGADIRNILNFEQDYPETQVITLEENYRSTQPILSAASSVIRNNSRRKEKNLRAYKGDGEVVTWCQVNNEYGEAEFVINSILSLKRRERLKNSDFAVFYRTNAQSRIFEDYLRREKIPYRIIGGLKFYDRKEIKDILAYLRFVANPFDSISLARIINTPARGIGKATLDRIRELAYTASRPEWQVISDGLLEKPSKGLEEFRRIMGYLRNAAREIPNTKLSHFIKMVMDETGYRRALEEENSVESASRLENLEELLNGVIDYELSNPDAGLDQFIQDISLYTSDENPVENPDDKDDMVTLMTVHNAKGLEFTVVFLTGMEEDTFPHRLALDTEEGLEEERRLCYVGITRAMERIFVTSAELRRTYSGVFLKMPSRFIYEIPSELMEIRQHVSGDYGSRERTGMRPRGISSYQERKVNPPVDENDGPSPVRAQAPAGDSSKFQVRENVMHPKYGVGRVEKIEGSGDNLKLTIIFSSGRKTFLEKYTPLEKLS